MANMQTGDLLLTYLQARLGQSHREKKRPGKNSQKERVIFINAPGSVKGTLQIREGWHIT
jgi:hypothetical protein